MNYYMIVTNEIDYEWDVDNQFVCVGFPDKNKTKWGSQVQGSFRKFLLWNFRTNIRK